ncbi:hypothetical protein JW933_03370 [candidate division FCPU426 bacterium]|nr:hypothetical protein [candidate division FCPU426 bacterium]
MWYNRKKYATVIMVALLMCWGGVFIAGCQPGQGGFRDRMRTVRKAKRQQMMKKLGIAKHLEGVDDASRIVFVAMVNGQAQIHTIQPDGEGQKQVTDTPGYKCRPAWNLPHDKIAFFQYHDSQPMGDVVSVMAVNADGSHLHAVVKEKRIKAGKMRISWKPDSSVVYFQEMDFPTILYGYEVETGRQVETIRLPKNSFMTEVHSLSPDMFFLAGAGPSENDNVMHIGTIRRDGTMETDLMKPFQQQVSYHLGAVVWNYDGSLVAFEVDKIIIVMSKRFSIDFEVHSLTPQDFSAELSGPAFSPTAKYMACIMEKAREGSVGSGDQMVASDVYVMNIDGTGQRQITHTGSCFDPHW